MLDPVEFFKRKIQSNHILILEKFGGVYISHGRKIIYLKLSSIYQICMYMYEKLVLHHACVCWSLLHPPALCVCVYVHALLH